MNTGIHVGPKFFFLLALLAAGLFAVYEIFFKKKTTKLGEGKEGITHNQTEATDQTEATTAASSSSQGVTLGEGKIRVILDPYDPQNPYNPQNKPDQNFIIKTYNGGINRWLIDYYDSFKDTGKLLPDMGFYVMVKGNLRNAMYYNASAFWNFIGAPRYKYIMMLPTMIKESPFGHTISKQDSQHDVYTHNWEEQTILFSRRDIYLISRQSETDKFWRWVALFKQMSP